MKKIVWILLSALTISFGAPVELTPAQMVLMENFDDEDESIFVDESAPSPSSATVTPKSSFQSKRAYEVESEQMRWQEETEPKASQRVDLSSMMAGQTKVALLVPKKVIGGYANAVANTIISYLLLQRSDFIFEVFDSHTEEPADLKLTLAKLKHKGYNFVIAPLTPKGANILSTMVEESFVFIPTVNQEDVATKNPNILFGGIDYGAQIDALLNYAQDRIVIFGDGSALSKKLAQKIVETRLEDVIYQKEIKNVKANISYLFRNNSKLKNSSVFLNMPVVKSALVASQLTRYKARVKNILSTQVNYSPLLFNLTQYADRKDFYIANSIGEIPLRLQDIALLLGENVAFNWIEYATMVGVDYVFTNYYDLRKKRLFSDEVLENQIYYEVSVVRAMEGSFKMMDIFGSTPSLDQEPIRAEW